MANDSYPGRTADIEPVQDRRLAQAAAVLGVTAAACGWLVVTGVRRTR